MNPDVPPVAQPVRRIPFSLRDKVKEKIEELVAMDMIEPVEGPTLWVSPVVVVPKQNDEIRLCVDMRRLMKPFIRERYPIPTVDEVLQNLNQSTVFSKLDLKMGLSPIRTPSTFQKYHNVYYTLWSIPVQTPYVWDKLSSRSVPACHSAIITRL